MRVLRDPVRRRGRRNPREIIAQCADGREDARSAREILEDEGARSGVRRDDDADEVVLKDDAGRTVFVHVGEGGRRAIGGAGRQLGDRGGSQTQRAIARIGGVRIALANRNRVRRRHLDGR